MIDSETPLVIDGHKIYEEKQELATVNDVREVYDVNLARSMNINRENNLLQFPDISAYQDITIDCKHQDNSIFVINGNIYEIKINDFLNVSLFSENSCVFSFSTNYDFNLSEFDYGANIIAPKNNNIHYYSNGMDTVLSDTLTNKIIKYSSSEKIGKHTYTKYYEFFEEENLGIYLLLINFKPYKLTTYNYSIKNSHSSFNFIY